jgi:hypothetical protein
MFTEFGAFVCSLNASYHYNNDVELFHLQRNYVIYL